MSTETTYTTKKKLLALDGGGVRGGFTIEVLGDYNNQPYRTSIYAYFQPFSLLELPFTLFSKLFLAN